MFIPSHPALTISIYASPPALLFFFVISLQQFPVMGPIISRIKELGSNSKSNSRHSSCEHSTRKRSSRQNGHSKRRSNTKRSMRHGQSPTRTYSPRPRNARRNQPASRCSSLSNSVDSADNSVHSHEERQGRRRGPREVDALEKARNQKNRDRQERSPKLEIRTRSPLPKRNLSREKTTSPHKSGRTLKQEEKGPRFRKKGSRHRTGMHKANRPHYKSSNLWTDQRKPPSPPYEAPVWTYKTKERGVLPVSQLPQQYPRRDGALRQAGSRYEYHKKEEAVKSDTNHKTSKDIEKERKEATVRHNQAFRAAAWNSQLPNNSPQDSPRLKTQMPRPQPLTAENLRRINAQHPLDEFNQPMQQTVATMTAVSGYEVEEGFIGGNARTFIEGMVPRSQAGEIFKLQRESLERQKREKRRRERDFRGLSVRK